MPLITNQCTFSDWNELKYAAPFQIFYANTPSWVLLQVWCLCSVRDESEEAPGRIDPTRRRAEGRRRQVRKTPSKDVLSLSLWSESRGPKRQTKTPQSPLSCALLLLLASPFSIPPPPTGSGIPFLPLSPLVKSRVLCARNKRKERMTPLTYHFH